MIDRFATLSLWLQSGQYKQNLEASYRIVSKPLPCLPILFLPVAKTHLGRRMYHIVSSWSAMALEPSEPVAAPPVLRGTHYGTAGVARMTVRAREPRSHQRPPGSFFDQPVNSTQETRIHQIERGSNVESRAASQMDEPAGRTGQHACSAGTTRRAAPAPAVSHSMRDRLVRLAYRFLWN